MVDLEHETWGKVVPLRTAFASWGKQSSIQEHQIASKRLCPHRYSCTFSGLIYVLLCSYNVCVLRFCAFALTNRKYYETFLWLPKCRLARRILIYGFVYDTVRPMGRDMLCDHVSLVESFSLLHLMLLLLSVVFLSYKRGIRRDAQAITALPRKIFVPSYIH